MGILPPPQNTSDDSYTDGAAVVTSDTVELALYARALYVGVSGDVTGITWGGQTLTFKAVPVGMLRVRFKQIKATGTTATNIIALF